MRKTILFLGIAILVLSCSPKLFKEKWLTETAPEYFRAKFETTQGDFTIVAK